MIEGRKVLAVIPARGGSKGVPRKNIRDVAGKPLIAWTILAAKASRFIDRLVVSSEDPEILEVARHWGCEVPFMRPAALAADSTPGVDPVLHALDELPGYDLVVLLQPTSPLRSTEDIDGCIELCNSAGADTCVSVTEPSHHPHWTYTLDGRGRLKPLVEGAASRRQELPRVFALNGAVYVARVDRLRETRNLEGPGTAAYAMPAERSIDIDSEADLRMASCLLASDATGMAHETRHH